jgi:2-polyprenyl-3-methyl-5-hydroxy-6-metoxy-1,4-benzoquinol methylase
VQANFQQDNLEFRLADTLDLAFAYNSFDVVICFHVYEHVPAPYKMFSEIRQVLKQYGI